MILKAPKLPMPRQYSDMTRIRDYYDQYYREAFNKWIKGHRMINIAGWNVVEVEWAYIIPLADLEALLKWEEK